MRPPVAQETRYTRDTISPLRVPDAVTTTLPTRSALEQGRLPAPLRHHRCPARQAARTCARPTRESAQPARDPARPLTAAARGAVSSRGAGVEPPLPGLSALGPVYTTEPSEAGDADPEGHRRPRRGLPARPRGREFTPTAALHGGGDEADLLGPRYTTALLPPRRSCSRP